MEEKKIDVVTYKAEGRVVIGEAVVHEDGTVSMNLSKEGLDLLGFEFPPGDFSISWYREYTKIEQEAMRRRASESLFDVQTCEYTDNYGAYRRYQGPPLSGERMDEQPREPRFNSKLIVQHELLESVWPGLQEALNAEMYHGYMEKIKNLKICTCKYSTKPCNAHPEEEPNVEG